MSLLEDVFLRDEAGEAQELERIIEGDDEYDERPRPSTPNSDDNSEKEDEAEEDKRRVEPASAKPKRVVKNPRVILNPARLTGPRGIQVIPEHFKDFNFKGKGHEKEDLDLVLKKLEHWAYRLFPKFQFADCLKKIESLGNKRPVMVHLTKIRTDQLILDETVVQRESSDEEAPQPAEEQDEFDKLLQQQIDLARATPAPHSVSKSAFSTPVLDKSLTMPKAISSPSINDEQRDRMLRNRQLAEERRLARLKQNSQSHINTNGSTTNDIPIEPDTIIINDNYTIKDTIDTNIVEEIADITTLDEDEHTCHVKNKRSNVIDSSDEDDALVINESVTVDVHNRRRSNSDEERSDTDNRRTNYLIQEEVGIVSEDVEINVIGMSVNNQSKSRSTKHNDSIDESVNSGDLDVVPDIASSTTNEGAINEQNIRCAILESNVGNERSDVINKTLTVGANSFEVDSNHEGKDKKNKSQNVEKTVINVVQNDSHKENENSHKENADSYKKNVDQHEKAADSHKGNAESYDVNADDREEETDCRQENVDSHKEKTDGNMENADSQKEKADENQLKDLMDVDFSDDF